MRHRTKTTLYGRWIKLVKKTSPKTGRRHYSVIVDAYTYTDGWWSKTDSVHNLYEALRDHFDPYRNRGMKTGLSWKFSCREDAEKLITMALLKWGDTHESLLQES